MRKRTKHPIEIPTKSPDDDEVVEKEGEMYDTGE
jgi:hypothetical protein